MDVIADFEAVIQEVRDARPVPFSASAIVDRKELLERLEALLEAIPGELKKARWIIEDRDDVLARIQQEAQETLERARRECNRLLSRPEIDRVASVEAERVIETAKSHAREIRLEAEHFVDGKLASLEVGLQKMLALVQSASSSFTDVSGLPPRPSSRPLRAAAPRQAPATDDDPAAMRPADPLEMPHTEARPAHPPVVERRPAPRTRASAGRARPKAPRPAVPPGSGQGGSTEQLRAQSTAAPRPADKREEPPAGSVWTLGLGLPRVRPTPAAPAPGPARTEPPAGRTEPPEGPAPASATAAPVPDRDAAPAGATAPATTPVDQPPERETTGTVRVIRSPVQRRAADPPASLF